MAERAKRRRLNPVYSDQLLTDNGVPSPSNCSISSNTDPKYADWSGFCEVESEPALFNVMLDDFGVKGVKVQEVVSLDDEMLDFLHKPVYGLIFLFRWKEDDPEKQEQSCPEGLWFANQTVNSACASVALLNIINNIDGIDLGEELQHFKDFTMPFTPALRGDAIGNFKFVKQIHNSFGREMDLLNSALQLKIDATQRKSKVTKCNQVFDESEAGFHFIAFVPAKGRVWKFDGLERQPQNLGECPGDNWLNLAKPEILSRMATYEEDQIEFSILSLVKDPIIDLTTQLALNVKSLSVITEQLASLSVPATELNSLNWDASSSYDATIHGPDLAFGLTQEVIDQVNMPEDIITVCKAGKSDALGIYRQKLMTSQKDIRASIKEEQQARRADEEHAAGRRHDYGPAVHKWAGILARKKMFQELLGAT